MGSEARRAFAAAALDVLLVQLQPYPAAFEAAPAELGPDMGAVERGVHSPEGVPDALRKEAGMGMRVEGSSARLTCMTTAMLGVLCLPCRPQLVVVLLACNCAALRILPTLQCCSSILLPTCLGQTR